MTHRSPFRVDTYCVLCRDTRAHYLKENLSDMEKDCFECDQCGRVIFANKGKAEGLRWYETRKSKKQ